MNETVEIHGVKFPVVKKHETKFLFMPEVRMMLASSAEAIAARLRMLNPETDHENFARDVAFVQQGLDRLSRDAKNLVLSEEELRRRTR